ncbi:hypothetical protein Bca4012_020855 [Brassica carinata]|uniref:Uncharacterized protein n=1 Tax=Brassica carinata TaxID=52824 RepID=A0A8X7WHU4_BRACI|nr:hypothetical protein Bca52824_000777 [Brassica carinata]
MGHLALVARCGGAEKVLTEESAFQGFRVDPFSAFIDLSRVLGTRGRFCLSVVYGPLFTYSKTLFTFDILSRLFLDVPEESGCLLFGSLVSRASSVLSSVDTGGWYFTANDVTAFRRVSQSFQCLICVKRTS